MKAKPVVPPEQAHRDVEDAVTHYLAEGAETAALGFIEVLQNVYRHIGRHPATGSPRYAHELKLPGLRFRSLTRYHCVVSCFEQPGLVDVWRVLHVRRDIPACMQ